MGPGSSNRWSRASHAMCAMYCSRPRCRPPSTRHGSAACLGRHVTYIPARCALQRRQCQHQQPVPFPLAGRPARLLRTGAFRASKTSNFHDGLPFNHSQRAAPTGCIHRHSMLGHAHLVYMAGGELHLAHLPVSAASHQRASRHQGGSAALGIAAPNPLNHHHKGTGRSAIPKT